MKEYQETTQEMQGPPVETVVVETEASAAAETLSPPETRASRAPALLAAGLIALLGIGVFFEGSWRQVFASGEAAQVAAAAATPNPFDGIRLEARAAAVYDALTGEMLYARNARQQLPLASITKIMTALVVSDVLAPDALISVPAEALAREGDHGLFAGERWYTQDLIDFALIESSNDAAEAVALAAAPYVPARGEEGIGRTIAAMNAKARELGLSQTYYLDATGLDIGENMASAYGSAEDVAYLFAYAITQARDVVSGTARNRLTLTSADGRTYAVTNTNAALSVIPGLIAGKTGYTDLAGGNLAVAFDAGIAHPVVVVVLGSTRTGRFSDMEALIAAARAYLAQEPAPASR